MHATHVSLSSNFFQFLSVFVDVMETANTLDDDSIYFALIIGEENQGTCNERSQKVGPKSGQAEVRSYI